MRSMQRQPTGLFLGMTTAIVFATALLTAAAPTYSADPAAKPADENAATDNADSAPPPPPVPAPEPQEPETPALTDETPAAGTMAAESAPASAPSDGKIHGPRDLLQLYDIGPDFFAPLADDEPLAFDEQEKLFRLLYRVQRMPLAEVDRWAYGAPGWRRLQAEPAALRGELFKVEGHVTQVDTIALTEEMQQRFELQRCYRCQFTAVDGTPLLVYAARVPQGWQRDQPIDERSSFVGLFVKRARVIGAGDNEAAEPRPLVFVTSRLASYSDTPLGKLHFDVGLLDDLRDRRAITEDERECFYQLLAAAGRSNVAVLDQTAKRQFATRREELLEQAPKLAKKSPERARAELELERAELNLSDVIPLFLEPGEQRGRLVVIEGRARRVLEVQVDDPDVVERFGIRHYYELEVFTDDSQGNPVVCCVRELPAGMPRGDNMNELVRVTGFFLKSWLYRADPASAPKKRELADGERLVVQRWAPLVIGRAVRWIPRPDPLRDTLIGWLTAVGIGLVSLIILVVVWRSNRRAHRSYQSIVAAGTPGNTEPGGARPNSDSPDFSGLE